MSHIWTIQPTRSCASSRSQPADEHIATMRLWMCPGAHKKEVDATRRESISLLSAFWHLQRPLAETLLDITWRTDTSIRWRTPTMPSTEAKPTLSQFLYTHSVLTLVRSTTLGHSRSSVDNRTPNVYGQESSRFFVSSGGMNIFLRPVTTLTSSSEAEGAYSAANVGFGQSWR